MADQDDGRAKIAVEFPKEVEDLGLDRHVERGGRLVGDQQRRLVAHAESQHDALAHAARKLVRIGVDRPLRRADAHSPEEATARSSAA